VCVVGWVAPQQPLVAAASAISVSVLPSSSGWASARTTWFSQRWVSGPVTQCLSWRAQQHDVAFDVQGQAGGLEAVGLELDLVGPSSPEPCERQTTVRDLTA